MISTTFKIGDRVRIIDCSTVESCELNKIGIIVRINDDNPDWIICIVDMGRPRREREPEKTYWWLSDKRIELVNKPNEQLVFEFMY